MFIWKDDDLNDEQQAAVLEENNVFLVACPGSGKTRTLTFKIAYELSRISSNKQFVVAITYTNRAADEIHERIENMGVDTQQLWIGTIHSFCLDWIIRPYSIYHDDLRYGYRVINSYDSEVLFSKICEDYKAERITHWDCGYIFTPKGYVLSCSTIAKHNSLHEILSKYFQSLQENKQMDFELILYYAHQLIISKPIISQILSNLFYYILIDEYQDTKEIQYSIFTQILKNKKTIAFIVGDPNQAIYDSLGGYAISHKELTSLSTVDFEPLKLEKNYRSTEKIINYFSHYANDYTNVVPASNIIDFPSNISYSNNLGKDDVITEIMKLIRLNINEHGISQNEICVLAPQWVYLAGMTRQLVSKMPEYTFDGPGMVPFARDIENFWYKLAKIALTTSSPQMYVRRIRWARVVLKELDDIGINLLDLTDKKFLKICNSISSDEQDGLLFLEQFFKDLFLQIDVDYLNNNYLMEHYNSFFNSSKARIDRLKKEGVEFIGNISTFRKVFHERSGITISTIHGVKGAEFDTVICYALLDGLVPHFNDTNGKESSKKLLYVICSRAKKHLHLISEEGRIDKFKRQVRSATPVLSEYNFQYD